MSWRERFKEYAKARAESFKGKYQGGDDTGSVKTIVYTLIIFLLLVAISVLDFIFFGVPPMSITGWALIALFTCTFLYLVSRPPTSFGAFITWTVSLAFFFIVLPWLALVSPLSPQIKNYYNIAIEGFSVVGTFFEGIGDMIARSNACFRDATSPECTSATTLPMIVKTLGIEIGAIETQIAIADRDTMIVIPLQNKGERDGLLRGILVYGNASKDCKGGDCVQKITKIECQDCSNQITIFDGVGVFNDPGEKVIPRDSRQIVATFKAPCNKNQRTYPFNVSLEYAYSIDASLAVDVMNKNEYESKLRVGEFRQAVQMTSTGGPVYASITFGSSGLQPIKSNTSMMVSIRFTNNQKGRFKLDSATINLPNQDSGAIVCTLLDGKEVTLPIIAGDDRWYKDSDMIIQCPVQIPKVEEQTKRYVATISAKYYYQVSKSGEVLIDTASIQEKCGTTTSSTTTTTVTTTTTT
ncbi:MAG: hypothetical protein V1731_03155 [Candidatus Aenigmatarchaeota archaeon]